MQTHPAWMVTQEGEIQLPEKQICGGDWRSRGPNLVVGLTLGLDQKHTGSGQMYVGCLILQGAPNNPFKLFYAVP